MESKKSLEDLIVRLTAAKNPGATQAQLEDVRRRAADAVGHMTDEEVESDSRRLAAEAAKLDEMKRHLKAAVASLSPEQRAENRRKLEQFMNARKGV